MCSAQFGHLKSLILCLKYDMKFFSSNHNVECWIQLFDNFSFMSKVRQQKVQC